MRLQARLYLDIGTDGGTEALGATRRFTRLLEAKGLARERTLCHREVEGAGRGEADRSRRFFPAIEWLLARG